jgi:RNA polymerase sigma factor (sigma-70 family)
MKLDPAIRDQVLSTVPSLRAFDISLCGNIDRADDLVQETLLRALSHIDSFEPGTNMPAWLFTILRNLFRSEYRKRRREVEDADGDPRIPRHVLVFLPRQRRVDQDVLPVCVDPGRRQLGRAVPVHRRHEGKVLALQELLRLF